MSQEVPYSSETFQKKVRGESQTIRFVTPDLATDVVRTGSSQVITNKTLIKPVIHWRVVEVTNEDYTAVVGDRFILVTAGGGDRTITIPDSLFITGYPISVFKVDTGSGDVIVEYDNQTCNGSSTITINNPDGRVEQVAQSSQWQITNIEGVTVEFSHTSGNIAANVRTNGTYTHFSASGTGSDASLTIPVGVWTLQYKVVFQLVYASGRDTIVPQACLSSTAPPTTPTEFDGDLRVRLAHDVQGAVLDLMNFTWAEHKRFMVFGSDTTLHIIGRPSSTPAANPTQFIINETAFIKATRAA